MSATSLAPINRLPNLRKRKRHGRYAVMLVESIPGWRPASLTSIPNYIKRVEFMARNVRLTEACVIAQAFNKLHIQPGYFDGRWALVVSSMFGWQPTDPADDAEMVRAIRGKGGAA